MFYYNLYNTEWIPFNIIALLIEVNSLFLHSRKLLQMIGVPFTSWLYRIVIFLNISTFVIFRGIPLIAISIALTQWYSRVTLTYYLSLCSSMFVMLVMNPILFMRLLRSDYLRKGTSRRNIKVMNGNNNHVGSVAHNKESWQVQWSIEAWQVLWLKNKMFPLFVRVFLVVGGGRLDWYVSTQSAYILGILCTFLLFLSSLYHHTTKPWWEGVGWECHVILWINQPRYIPESCTFAPFV